MLFVYLVTRTSLYATTAIVVVIIAVQIYLLIRYIEETNRILARFLTSIRYSDFSQTFSSTQKGKSFAELNDAVSEVIKDFQKVRAEKEEQYRYLQTVVRHVGIGLMAYDNEGAVDLINQAAKRLLKVNQLNNINSLSRYSGKLVAKLKELKPGERALLKVESDGERLQLSIHATMFKLQQRPITLVSIQNIESELAEQEMEAWQKLIRILTHEIMNSVTPIASLASTVNELINESAKTGKGEGIEIDGGVKDDINQAVATIEKRSQGLLAFINAYRDLTRIPKPNFQAFKVSDLFERVLQLMKSQLDKYQVRLDLDISPEDLELVADKELIEQVLINLLLNSHQALEKIQDSLIELKARTDGSGRILIMVKDNGPGIDQSVTEKIFLPFFTTKKDGSGIGLSLSRQIMRLHGGSIKLQSSSPGNTVFVLKF